MSDLTTPAIPQRSSGSRRSSGSAHRDRGSSMRAPRLLVALAAAALLAPLGATTASAAPTNDTVAGATAITSLPKTVTQDTRTATTDTVDAGLNAICGAPAT